MFVHLPQRLPSSRIRQQSKFVNTKLYHLHSFIFDASCNTICCQRSSHFCAGAFTNTATFNPRSFCSFAKTLCGSPCAQFSQTANGRVKPGLLHPRRRRPGQDAVLSETAQPRLPSALAHWQSAGQEVAPGRPSTFSLPSLAAQLQLMSSRPQSPLLQPQAYQFSSCRSRSWQYIVGSGKLQHCRRRRRTFPWLLCCRCTRI